MLQLEEEDAVNVDYLFIDIYLKLKFVIWYNIIDISFRFHAI